MVNFLLPPDEDLGFITRSLYYWATLKSMTSTFSVTPFVSRQGQV